jgi:hypothetical protein
VIRGEKYMKKLSLPSFEYKLIREGETTKIFDIIRKKYFVLTPEEWVRQHFVHYLIDHLKYAKSLISVETGLKYNQLKKRSDIIVYDKDGSPFLLVECKSAETQISKKALFQVFTYNQTIKARYLVITNGLAFICAKVNEVTKQLEWIDALPPYPK